MRQGFKRNNILGRTARKAVKFASMAVLASSLSHCAAQITPIEYCLQNFYQSAQSEDIERARKVTSDMHSIDEEIVTNFAYGFSQLGEKKTLALNKELGIRYFCRYSKETLTEVYKNYISDVRKNEQPVLLVVFNKNDWNGAFYQEGRRIDKLLKGYKTIIAEKDHEGAFYWAIRKTAKRVGKIDTLVVGGHGTRFEINLGKENDEKSNISIDDADELKSLREYFVDFPVVVLDSCSTGSYENFAIGEVISKALNATVFAPEFPTNIAEYVLDPKGRVHYILMHEGKTRIYRGEIAVIQ